MAKISIYPLDGDPKLSDKLIGTSVGYNESGELKDPTYNFSLQQLLDLFLPNIPANNLQGVLDFGNTADQDINLFGKITTTNLEVTNLSNLVKVYVSDEIYVEGFLFDKLNSSGTLGQVLSSTVDGIKWVTLPPIFTPSLQQVLAIGNIADIDIILNSDIEANSITTDVVTCNNELYIKAELYDWSDSTGTSGQILVSLGDKVEWQDFPLYTSTSPLFVDPATKIISIQEASSTQDGYLSLTDWISFDGKQNALSGTGIVFSNGGVISYLTNNSANWNQAYNDTIVSAEVTGSSTKILTLTKRDGNTITANWSDPDTGLTSVGVSMPSAFSVANSPLVSNGVIAITGAGNALQYIKGDGTLGTFPILTGYVPYTGATQDVDLGIYDLTASAFIKSGGTAAQFLKANGSVDSNVYALDSAVVKLTGVQTVDGIKTFSESTKFDYGIYLKQDGITASFPGYTTIDGTTNGYVVTNGDGRTAFFNLANVTSLGYTYPSTSGTLALTSELHSPVTIGTANGLSLSGQQLSLGLASSLVNGALSSTDWNTFNNKQTAGNYITSLTGEVTASGPGAASATLNNASVTGKILSGVNITGGTIIDTDTMLTAFGKLQNQINGLIGGSIYQGVWNANTNTPTLTSSVGTDGYYYIVNVAGGTNLNGITDWKVGDWAIFHGGTWQKVDNTDAVSSVNGFTGAVSLTTDNISEGTSNLYFLNSRARAAISFAAGSGAYNSTTGVITIPTNNNQITNGSNFITLASLSGSAPIQYNNTTGAISITQSGAVADGFLSSTDWNTFNNKQNALTNPITGTGTTNFLPKFTGASSLGNSNISDNGTVVTISTDAVINGVNIGLGGGAVSTNTRVGLSALGVNTIGSNNAAFGAYALGNNTTGSENVAIGDSALPRNTIGIGNVAIGCNAGSGDTGGNEEGSYNIFIGYYAQANLDFSTNEIVIGKSISGLGSNSTVIGNFQTIKTAIFGNLLLGDLWDTGEKLQVTGGAKITNDSKINEITVGKGGGNEFYSTAIGLAALQNNTTGANNSAFGYTCLYENTTGKDNTAVGTVALRRNTSGYNNTAVGTFSIHKNTIGFNNTALGYGASKEGIESSGDTSIGAFSFFEKVTGSNNTGLGRSVGYSMIDGNENVFIGWNAGRLTAVGQDSNTISNSSIYIGSHASPQLDNQANQIAIGHFAQGLGSNTTVLGNDMTSRTAIYGNLLLGTTADTGEKLQVTGSAKITNDSKISGLTIGKGLGGFDSNTVLGLDALSANTTGVENVAIGWQALLSNTTGNGNSSFGYASLQSNTQGRSNAAFGWKSLQKNVSGINSTAVGHETLIQTISGDNNTALGQASLRDLASGANNSGLGQGSLYRILSGDNNTAVGQFSQYNALNTSNNTAVGQFSLFNNRTGSSNIALGQQAGAFLADKTTAATILNSSIMIGTRSSPLGNNQSNQIVIGHDSTGLGSNTTVIGNASTVVTAIYGRTVFGATSVAQSAQLQVESTTRGMIIPRMTTAQVNAIASPSNGLIVYNTTLNTLCFYIAFGGSPGWQRVNSSLM